MSATLLFRRSSMQGARCLSCGYLLYGLHDSRCPECGRQFDPSDGDTFFYDPAPVAEHLVKALVGWTLALPLFVLPLFAGSISASLTSLSWSHAIFKAPLLLGPLIVTCLGVMLIWSVFCRAWSELLFERGRITHLGGHLLIALCSGLSILLIVLSVVVTAYSIMGFHVF